MRRLLAFVFVVVVCSLSAGYATNNYSFAGDSEGSPGDSVTIVVDGETDVEIKGYSIVFVYDAAVFDYVSSTVDGTRGEDAVIFAPGSTDSTVSAGVVYSFSCPPSIPAGTGPLLMVTLEIRSDAPTGTTDLDLRDVSPSLNRLSACSGTTITPALTDGTFEVLGEEPVCSVEPTWLDFGDVAVDSFADLSFTIRNTGGGTLMGTVSETCEEFSIVAGEGPYELSAYESREVTVRFTPPEEGDYLCTVETGTELCEDVTCEGSSGGPGGTGYEERAWSTGLLSPTPNPSSGTVIIRFSLRRTCSARVAVYDLGGRTVRRLVSESLPRGLHSVTWDGLSGSGNALPAGVYYICLAACGESTSRRVITLD